VTAVLSVQCKVEMLLNGGRFMKAAINV